MKSTNGSDNVTEKKYLSIGEMAAKFNVSVELLRKWEKDFPRVLRPKRTSGDSRLYDHKQQNNVAMIYRLLREEGLSVSGAKKRLSNKQSEEEVRQEVIERLGIVRQQLMSIVEELDHIEHPATEALPQIGIIWENKQ